MLAVASTLDSCKSITSRYRKPEQLTKQNEKLLLTNINIIDVKNSIAIKNKNILIYNGHIEAILSKDKSFSITPDRVVNLQGHYAMPGLINAHCHITMPGGLGYDLKFLMSLKRQAERNAEECIKHGVTTVRDMFAPSDWLDDLREKINKQEIIGPRIQWCCAMDVRRGYLSIPGSFTKNKYWKYVSTPSQAIDAVKRSIDQGPDFIKLFQQRKQLFLPGKLLPMMDVKTIEAICNEANRHGKQVALHHTELFGLKNGLEGGIDSFEHMPCDKLVTDKEIEGLMNSKASIIPTASVPFGLAHERKGDPNWGKKNVLYIAEKRNQLMPGLLKTFCEPDVEKSSIKTFNKLRDPASFEKYHILPYIDPSYFTAGADMGAKNTIKLYHAGVTFGAGNDGGVPFCFPGALPLELSLLEEQGIKTVDLIKMVTYSNAKIMGLEHSIGTIENGKLADLIITEKNPLHTVQHLSSPSMVFKEGEILFSKNQHT